MRLQKNTLLALYSVLEFAAQPGRQLSVADIAAGLRVSPHHLAKVLRTLGRAGLVNSVRGARGGYRFVGNAKRVTLMDVIALFEDIGAPARRSRRVARGAERALEDVLAEIDQTARATFGSVTLDTMLKLMGRRERG
ncbi:MAG: Rrf2 family transcriptional regulator [Burkholderiales bacterium]